MKEKTGVHAAVSIIIVGGLSWCFYRALTATDQETDEQVPDEG